MSVARLELVVPDGETLRYQTPTRDGWCVGVTDERVLLVAGEVVDVPLEKVESVDVRSFNWLLAGLSVFLVAAGGLVARNRPRIATGIVLAGIASLAVTYHKRGLVTVDTHSPAAPLQFHLDDPDAFCEYLEGVVAELEA